MSDLHPEARDYLKRLDRALSHAPRSRRREIVGEVEAHIKQALAELGDGPQNHEVTDVLEQLGEPESIAAEEVGVAVPSRRWGAVEIGALVLLPIGAFVLPFIGWVIGVVLLWVSSVWTTRDKLIGTFIVPGGLAFPFYLMVFGAASSEICSGSASFKASPGRRTTRLEEPTMICERSGGFGDPLITGLLILLVLAAVGSVIYLGRRMTRAVPT